jgi:hypothetical protein
MEFIGWNLENWVTVMLMAALGYAILALASQFIKQGGAGIVPSLGGKAS